MEQGRKAKGLVQPEEWEEAGIVPAVAAEAAALVQDPVELENLYGRPETREKQMELLEDLLAWTLRAADPLPLPRRRYAMKRDPRNYWSPYRK